jgi:hypothetical protein
LAPPTLILRPASDLVAGYVAVTVTRHEPAFAAGRRTVLLRTSGDEAITLDYSPPGGQALPLARGDQVLVRYFPGAVGGRTAGVWDERPVEDHSRREVRVATRRRVGEPDLAYGGVAGWALLIREPDGVLRAALYSGVQVPLSGRSRPGGRGDQLIVEPADPPAYTEVRRLDSRCLATLEHRPLRVLWRERGATRQGRPNRALAPSEGVLVPPGTFAAIVARDRRYRVIALDASALGDGRCEDADPGHVSFAILVAARPVTGAAPKARTASGAPPSSADPPPAAPR